VYVGNKFSAKQHHITQPEREILRILGGMSLQFVLRDVCMMLNLP
jgi:hypothetical protein